MWRFLPLLLLVAGCDVFGDASADLMSRLDGTWDRTIVRETIASDGTVTESEPMRDQYYVLPVVTCPGGTQIGATDDDSRVAGAVREVLPSGEVAPRDCAILTSDSRAERVIFIGGGGSIVSDAAGTIIEDSENRQVWHFYSIQSGSPTIRSVWTLTR